MYEYENKIVGILIGYYRQKRSKKDENFSRRLFVKWKSEKVKEMCLSCSKNCAKKDRICAPKTSLSIEKGEPIKNICFYIDFADKLGYRYLLNQRLLDIIHYSEKKLMLLIKTNQKKELITFKVFLQNNLKNYKDIIYFSEMLQLYLAITCMLLDFTYPKVSLVDLFEKIYPHLNSQSQFFISFLLYRYYKIYHEDKNKQQKYLNLLQQLETKNTYHFLLNQKEKMTSLEFYRYLLDFDKNKFLPYEQYIVQDNLVDILIELGHYNEAKKQVDICVKIAESKDEELSDVALYSAYTKKAVVLYHLKQYDEALLFFKQVFHFNADILLLNFILFIDCFEKSSQSKSIKSYLDIDTYRSLNITKVKRLYRYYQQKYVFNYPFKELELFILDELKSFLPLNSAYYEIIKKDMIEYCQETKDYKSFFLFQKNKK